MFSEKLHSSSSRRFCMAVWFVLSSALLALVGVFVGTLGALMKVSSENSTVGSNSLSSSSILFGLYGHDLYSMLAPIDRNFSDRTDQLDFTVIFGRWQLHSIFLALGWLLAFCSIVAILLPICRPHTKQASGTVGESMWLLFLGLCITVYSLYALSLIILVVLYYVFRESATLATVDFMNNYAFGDHYAGDYASQYRGEREIFTFTLLINFIQRAYSCCGFTSYRDYSGGAARLWTHKNLQSSSQATLPLACCADLTSGAAVKNVTLTTCRSDITSGVYRAHNWNTAGCYQTLVLDIGQRVAIGSTTSLSVLIIVLSAAVVSGSLLVDMERSSRRRLQSRNHQRRSAAANQPRRLEPHMDEWQPSPSYSDDEEFYYPNKIYAHRF